MFNVRYVRERSLAQSFTLLFTIIDMPFSYFVTLVNS